MLTKKIYQIKIHFFFPNSHSVNVDLGSPSHEYSLFTAISNSLYQHMNASLCKRN